MEYFMWNSFEWLPPENVLFPSPLEELSTLLAPLESNCYFDSLCLMLVVSLWGL